MKKVKQMKGFVIALDKEESYFVFTKDEWSYGDGLRSSEWECGSEKEAVEFIESY